MSVVSLEPEIERRLVKQAQRDKKKFAPLYNHYLQPITKFITSRTSDPAMAQDLISKTFEKALKSIDNFQWQGVSFSAWLYRIAKNTLIDHYRSKEHMHTPQTIEEMELPSHAATPDKVFETEAENKLLYQMLNELPPKEREIIYLKFFDGYTNKVIANLSNLTETNVGTIVYRAIKRIRELYKEK